MKNIWINHQMYELSLVGGVKGNTSGVCYHLKDETVDWAVKLYYEEDWDEKLYPTLEDLEFFGRIHERIAPIIVSQYPVFDSSGRYIGCCAPFIYESQGKTEDVIYQKPSHEILMELHKVEDILPIATENRIALNDLTLFNMKYGKTKDLKQGIYLFDDSFYEVSSMSKEKLTKWNQNELNELIYTIVALYFFKNRETQYESDEQKEFFARFHGEIDNSLALLEEESGSFQTLGDYLEFVRKKKYRIN